MLHGITLTDAYAKALAQAALSPIRGVSDLVTRPVQTVEAVPHASPRFRREAESLGIRVREEVGRQLPLVD